MSQNVFNICASVPIYTKLYTCKIRVYGIEYLSGACLIARVGRAFVVHEIISPTTLVDFLRYLQVW